MHTAQSAFAYGLNSRPLYATLVQFPVVCFVGTLITDIAYLRTELYLWQSFSAWLLAVGCVLAGVAGIVGLAIFLRDRNVRAAPFAWPYALISLAAALLSVANAFVHSRDGYTAVVPTGLTLSLIVVVLMVVATALGWRRPRRAIIAGEPP
ncbi:MAG TPA: DUF2231 domain-containing protein [Telluria sp.]|nr:DUF2231 domain-containing protein [Telluria sp.]